MLCDVDGNGVLDILCGAGDGKVYLFLGQGGLEFKPMGAVIETGLSGQVLPDYGDLDGDGIADVVCGSNEGKLLVFYGTGPLSFTAAGKELSVFGVDGSWIAPRIYDIDGTGGADLLLGTFGGYVAKLLSDAKGGYSAAGFTS